MEFASNCPEHARADDSYRFPHGRSLFMGVNLLNDNQRRRLGTHLRLLVSDLDTLAESPELRRDSPAFATVRDAIATARRSADELRAALALPLERSPSLARRVGAVAEVWAARIDDLRARRLPGDGPGHPDPPAP